jgi:hypothetical protein
MTGCEVIAYLNGKTYIVKFRHDGMDIPDAYFVESPIDFSNDPEKELVKMMDWWGKRYGDGDDEITENIKRFVWVHEKVWNRKKEAIPAYCETNIKDEDTLGFGYQCGYGDYGILIDFEKKTVTSLGDGRINNIQKNDKVSSKVVAEYNRRKKQYEKWEKERQKRGMISPEDDALTAELESVFGKH